MPHEIIKSIADRIRESNLLDHIIDKLHEEFGIVPVIGAEIEFYVIPNLEINTTSLKLPYEIKSEKGNGQFEIDIFPQENIHKTIEEITKAKAHLSSLQHISLHPKPYVDDYGSAMHFHINFLQPDGKNFFDNKDNLESAAKSLCHFLVEDFLIFAPKADHYSRFHKDFMAPTHVCFGGNNRSAAIRIPDAKPRRLEHRISSPETDEHLAVYAILNAIYRGLKEPGSIKNYQKIYGNAFDEQYGLEDFPGSVGEAVRKFFMPSARA